jgi:deoxycytidylate deaminase
MAIPEKLESRQLNIAGKKKSINLIDSIESRKTDELVISICGAVGSGVSTVSDEIYKVLKSVGYTVKIIKLSKHITDFFRIDDIIDQYERIKTLQEKGNFIRENYGNDILSQLAIRDIFSFRDETFHAEQSEYEDIGEQLRQKRRHVTIIDSLKNPQEVDLLKKVYGNMFYLFGVLCNDNLRKERLIKKGMNDANAADLMQRDKEDKESHGQQLLKTLQHADFFIRNNRHNISSIEKPIKRFIDLILGQNNITPTINEFGMYIAESSARRSGCISRQVGASILTEEGDIVSTGRNDVPKPLGGLYGEEDGEDDCRCFRHFDHSCANQKNKDTIFNKIEQLIIAKTSEVEGIAGRSQEVASQIISSLKRDSEIKDLIEYSRAVHAEMDAITSAARNGNYSLRGTILFSTTFPCHHCARHIVAAGIKKVYYIEPYEKSLATKLHSDAIALDSQPSSPGKDKVIFTHFEGVAPKQYLHLFSCNNRKKDGKLINVDLISQHPTRPSFLDTFIEYESKVVEYVNSLINQPHGQNNIGE